LQGIISSLKESELFESIQVIELIDEESVKLIKIMALLKGGTALFITELHTSLYQKYSYHWQDKYGQMIMRWDNKPHWPKLKTFPHHKHEKGEIISSSRITVVEVIENIKANLGC
jgi:hypothetical protein